MGELGDDERREFGMDAADESTQALAVHGGNGDRDRKVRWSTRSAQLPVLSISERIVGFLRLNDSRNL
jgi:hypothetical protein